MKNKGVNIYSIDAECNKMTIHLDEIKKVCDAKKLSEDKINKIIEYIKENNSEERVGADYFIIHDYFEDILGIIKGDGNNE